MIVAAADNLRSSPAMQELSLNAAFKRLGALQEFISQQRKTTMNPNLKFQMKNKVYILHTDPGHGWLAVKKRELEVLGITGISVYSYVKGNTVYLEEDCDAALFFNAYEGMFGKRPNYRVSYLERTPIRYYDRMVNESPSVQS